MAQSVSISGFGVFEKRARAARTARNPRTGEAVKVKKTTVPAFRPGKYFKDVIAGTVKLPKATAAPTSARAAAAAAQRRCRAEGRRRQGPAAARPTARTRATTSAAAKAAPKTAAAKPAAPKVAAAAPKAARRAPAGLLRPRLRPRRRPRRRLLQGGGRQGCSGSHPDRGGQGPCGRQGRTEDGRDEGGSTEGGRGKASCSAHHREVQVTPREHRPAAAFGRHEERGTPARGRALRVLG